MMRSAGPPQQGGPAVWYDRPMNDFHFEELTPALQAWLDHIGQPNHDPAERDRLRAAVPRDLMARWFQAQKQWRCRDASQVGEAQVHPSPSGRYTLHVTQHAEGPNTWSYARGRVYAGEVLIAEICRNFGHFPFAWIEHHPSGHAYLIGGEDYQGQTVIELDTGRRAEHLPPEADEGVGFCWVAFEASPSGLTLAVDGCYWACPYELRLVDLSDPLAGLPVLTYIDDEGSFAWEAADTCLVTRNVERYVPTGTPVNQMSAEEDADQQRRQAAGEKGLWRTEAETETWVRPPLASVVAQQVAVMEAAKRSPRGELLNNLRELVRRLPEEEQAGWVERLERLGRP